MAQVLVSFGYMKLQHQSVQQFSGILKNLNEYTFLLWGALASAVGTLFLFVSFNFTLASIASPITSTYPVITIILAHIFLKDKISVKNWVGIILVVGAIIGVGILTK